MSEKIAESNLYARAEHATRTIRARTSLEPRVALVLGSGLGALADELAGAFLVNPHDIEGLKDAIVRAATANPAEARRRMRAMRRRVREHDVARWAASFLDSLSDAPSAAQPAWEPEAS